MELSFGVLGMAPATFWAMSVAEWGAAVAGYLAAHGLGPGSAPLSRAELAALTRQYPD